MQWGKEKRFILKCEYPFFRMIVYGYEILYTIFNIVCFSPLSILSFCSYDARQMFLLYMDVLLHSIYVVSCWLL